MSVTDRLRFRVDELNDRLSLVEDENLYLRGEVRRRPAPKSVPSGRCQFCGMRVDGDVCGFCDDLPYVDPYANGIL